MEVLRYALLRKYVSEDDPPISLRPIMDQGLMNLQKTQRREPWCMTPDHIQPTPIWAVVNSRVPESPLAGYDCAEALDGASSYASFLVWYRSVLSKLDIDEEKVIKDNFLTRLWPNSTECSEDGEKSNKRAALQRSESVRCSHSQSRARSVSVPHRKRRTPPPPAQK